MLRHRSWGSRVLGPSPLYLSGLVSYMSKGRQVRVRVEETKEGVRRRMDGRREESER